MQFTLGILCGVILGSVVAMTYVAQAQWVPFDAPLERKLALQQQENHLKMERSLERQHYAPLDPCRR